MVLPPGDDPERFHWPVAGIEVVLIQWGAVGPGELERAELALLRAGARLVLAVTTDEPIYCYPEAQHDAA